MCFRSVPGDAQRWSLTGLYVVFLVVFFAVLSVELVQSFVHFGSFKYLWFLFQILNDNFNIWLSWCLRFDRALKQTAKCGSYWFEDTVQLSHARPNTKADACIHHGHIVATTDTNRVRTTCALSLSLIQYSCCYGCPNISSYCLSG